MSVLDSLLDGCAARARREALSEGFGSGTNPAAEAKRSMTPAQRATAKAATRKVNQAGTATGSDDAKHPRGRKGTSQGGKFVRSGSSGSTVTGVQHRVGEKTDGNFGPKTQAAVRRFQQRHRLVVDGVVGHQTALAMAGKFTEARRAKTGALNSKDHERLRSLRPPKSTTTSTTSTKPRGTAPTRPATSTAPTRPATSTRSGGGRRV